MASQVLSGSNNVSYTNNTGQNVRIIINYMANPSNMTWAGVTINSNLSSIGRNLAAVNAVAATFLTSNSYNSSSISAQNAFTTVGASTVGSAPTEIMLSTGQTFSATCGAYNIVVIPEGG